MSRRLNDRRDANHEAVPVKVDRRTTQAVCVTCGGAISRLYGTDQYRHGSTWGVAAFDTDADIRMGEGPRHYEGKPGFTLCGFNWKDRGGRRERLSDGQAGALCSRCKRLREAVA